MSTTKADATPSTAEHTSTSPATPAAFAPSGLVQQLGNQGLEALLRARLMQAKLSVSDPLDPYEQEADDVAARVMRMPSPMALPPVGAIQRLPEGERDVRRFSTTSDVPTVDAATEHAIHSLSGRGSALPESVRSFMEPRIGANLSAVRVHTDAEAQGLARRVNAKAFTVGPNVVFGAGHYSPDTPSGQHLLAHELTHVVQQSAAPRLDRKPATTEWVAQRAADRDPGQVPTITRAAPLAVARETVTATLTRRTGLPAREIDDPVQVPFQDPFKDPVKPARTIEDWANGSLDISTLQSSELQPAIDELQQWLDRQNGSSFTSVRIEATLSGLRRELRKRYVETKNPAHHRGDRGKKGKPAERPKISPRVLTEKNVSIGYANPAEARAEFDLIMQWLTIPGLDRGKRLLLLKERANLEWLLADDRKRASSERYVARVRTALTSSEKDPSAALVSVVRTIDGITKDPDNEEISYIYHHGERLAISTEQAAQLRKDMVRTLDRAAFEIWEGVAQQALRDRARQVKINDEERLVSRVSEIFTGHLLSYAEDPYMKMLHRNGEVFDDLRTLREHLKAGHLTEAAGRLPHMEKRAREMAELADEFTETYLRGAQRAVTTFEITAKLAVSIELAIVTAGTASFVSGLVGTGGLGLTGVSAGVVTTLGTGVGVGGITAVARGGVSVGLNLATGHSLADSVSGLKGELASGFLEGFMAGATGGAARVLAPALGVGANVGFQRARQAGAEAIVNGTSAIVQAIKDKKSVGDAIKAGALAAALAIPAGAIGSGTTKKLIFGSLATYGTAFAGAYAEGASTEDAIKAASIAMITHLSASKLGHATDAKLARAGAKVGKTVKTTAKSAAIKTTAAIAIGTAKALPHLSFEGPRVGLHDTTVSAPASPRLPAPTPDPVGRGAPEHAPTEPEVSNPEATPAHAESDGSAARGATTEKSHDNRVGDADLELIAGTAVDPVDGAPEPKPQAPHEAKDKAAPSEWTDSDERFRLLELDDADRPAAQPEAPSGGTDDVAERFRLVGEEIADARRARGDRPAPEARSEWTDSDERFSLVGQEIGPDSIRRTAKAWFVRHQRQDPLVIFAKDMPDSRFVGVEKYVSGEIGNSVRNLDLRGMTAERIGELLKDKGFQRMDDVVRLPSGQVFPDDSGNDVPLIRYLHPDGGMVSVLVNGHPGAIRSWPAASKSVRWPTNAPPRFEACKVDNAGNPVPATRKDLRNPYPPGTKEHRRFADGYVEAAHTDLANSGSTGIRASNESPRGPEPKVTPLRMRPRDLQLLAAERLRRPVPDLKGKVHFYRNQDDYEFRYRSDSGESGPAPAAYTVNESGEIHVSPGASVDSAIHEVIHAIALGEEPLGWQFIGSFLDEGVTDAIARAGSNASLAQSAYQKHMAFYRLLRRILGPGVIETAVLHGRYTELRARVLEVFGGDDARTREFFYKLQRIGGEVEDRLALDEAVSMLEEATGRPVLQWSRSGPQPPSTANSPRARIERVGPFSFLGEKNITQEGRATIIDRRISAMVRSGVPIAEADMPLLLRHLVDDAKASGGTRLRIAVEFVEDASAPFLQSLANVFYGIVSKSGSVYVIDIDVGAQAAPRSSGPENVPTRSADSRTVRKSVVDDTSGVVQAGDFADTEKTSVETDKTSPAQVEAETAPPRQHSSASVRPGPAARPTRTSTPAPREEVPKLTSEQLGADIDSERIGNYVVKGKTETKEGVFHRTIEDFDHVDANGQIDGKSSVRDLFEFINLLMDQARAAKATRIRISRKLIENPNVRKIDLLAKHFKGSAHLVDDQNIELEGPVAKTSEQTVDQDSEETSSTANTAPNVSEPTPGAQGSRHVSSAQPGPSILVVGAETAGEFSYARTEARRGAHVVVVNPIATDEANTFQQAGGTFVQAKIEDLPETSRFDLIREDYPDPAKEFWSAKNLVSSRLKRLNANGHWIVVTESEQFVETLRAVGEVLKASVIVHEAMRPHEATPVSRHPEEPTRYVVTLTRSPETLEQQSRTSRDNAARPLPGVADEKTTVSAPAGRVSENDRGVAKPNEEIEGEGGRVAGPEQSASEDPDRSNFSLVGKAVGKIRTLFGRGGGGPAPFSATELQHAAAEVLRRPVEDLHLDLRRYPTHEAFENAWKSANPGREMPSDAVAYYDRNDGQIHLSPLADLDSAIHEVVHKVRDSGRGEHYDPRPRRIREYLGAFLDEGVAEGLVRQRPGRNPGRAGYAKNVAFYWMLKRALGSDSVDLLVLHPDVRAREIGSRRAAEMLIPLNRASSTTKDFDSDLRKLFHGSALRAHEFLEYLRRVGPNAEDPEALDRAVAMLEEATGQTALELLPPWISLPAPSGVRTGPAANSGPVTVEHAGRFNYVAVRQQPTNKVTMLTIKSANRSGLPIAESDLRAFLDALVTQAQFRGLRKLEIFPEFIKEPDLPLLKKLAAEFGGTADDAGSVLRLDFPIVALGGGRFR